MPTVSTALLQSSSGQKCKTTSVQLLKRKKTHTDRYLSFHSHHGMQAKANSVRTRMNRVRHLTSNQHRLKDELHHVQGVQKCNGYSKGFVRKYKVQLRQEKGKKSDDNRVDAHNYDSINRVEN